jgi:eukaryotic-like serine/threonine-protein kinase
MDSAPGKSAATVVGRYSLHSQIAQGGMATVHVGRLMGPVGFSRTVAIKRLHSQFAGDPEFVAMFMDEARLAARIQHPNVVSIIDVVAEKGELLLVMDYVQGESLSRLLRTEAQRGSKVDPRIAVKIMTEVLSGLHAAHEARNERGSPLGIVHRDVSPQNILVGADGVSHLIDFGVAKAAGRMQSTRDGQLKGKLAYMPPEQIRAAHVDRRTDIYSAAAVLWEALVGSRLFNNKGDEANLMYSVLTVPIAPPSSVNPAIEAALDAVVLKGLQKNPEKRYATAIEMADALEAVVAPASSREVARWMEQLAANAMRERADLVAEVESFSHVSIPPPGDPSKLDFAANLLEEVSAASADGPPVLQPTDLPTDTSSSISGIAEFPPKRSGTLKWLAIGAGVLVLVSAVWFVARFTASPATPANASASSASAVATAPASEQPQASAAPVASASTPAASQSAVALPPSTSARPAKAAPPVATTAPIAPASTAKKKTTYTRD